eukprot:NODE_2469_length_920_cov_72.466131_g2028_i0.p1 GENE.NODE_2469_length_920_cov_72.466131_g2028_i0~~NODE_2469_length_920_cov_72.466131_g2028_i0.p1  ORF type:complete len:282 (-),score=44.81 NODE_2469_length_920_cov_72.466131_g2028_i0:75-899(-)
MGAYGIGIPVLGAMVIHFGKGPVAFARTGLRPRFWFWELTMLLRKAVTVAIVVLVRDPFLQAYFAAWVVAMSSLVTIKFRPYKLYRLNEIEATAYGLLAATMTSSLLYQYIHADSFLYYVLTSTLLAVNIITILLLLTFLKDPLCKTLNRILHRFSALKKWLPSRLLDALDPVPTTPATLQAVEAAFEAKYTELMDKVHDICEPLKYSGDDIKEKVFRAMELARGEIKRMRVGEDSTSQGSRCVASQRRASSYDDIERHHLPGQAHSNIMDENE